VIVVNPAYCGGTLRARLVCLQPTGNRESERDSCKAAIIGRVLRSLQKHKTRSMIAALHGGIYLVPNMLMSNEPRVHSAEQIEAARIALCALDPALAVAHAATEPFGWRIRQSGFIGLAQLIIEQQVSVASAAAIWGRFESRMGTVTSRRVLKFDVDALRALGLSRQKAQYIRGIAEAEASGAFDFDNLRKLGDEEAIAELTKLKGVGRWTAEVYLLFCEGRTDLFPAGDLALQEGLRHAESALKRLSEKKIYARAERWRPHRGTAAILLWSYYRAIKNGQTPKPPSKSRKSPKRKKAPK
jgi:DNA-3-methyladenine glycosylase II